jgi:tetratricopeptide (TPR) repeat protein
MMRSRSGRIIPLAILLGAFIIRLVFLLQAKDLQLYYHPLLDSGFYHELAKLKAAVSWTEFVSPFKEPLYTDFVGLIYLSFRESLTIIRIIQSIIGSLTALLVYYSAKMIYGNLAAIVAGIILALYSTAVFFSSEINETGLALFLLISSVYLLLRAQASRPLLNSGLSGLVLGVALLAKMTLIAAVPAWIIHLLLSKESRLRWASIVFVVGLVIAPLAYNLLSGRQAGHPIIPLRTSWHAFLGSGQSGGTSKEPYHQITVAGEGGAYRAFVSSDWLGGQKDARRFARIATGEPISYAAAGRYWQQRSLEDFVSDPARYLRNYFVKLGLFWGPSEPPANIDSRFVARYSFLSRNPLCSFAVIVPLGLLGLLQRAERRLLCASIFILLCSVVSSIYLVTDAEKIMIIPFMAVFAGALISRIVSDLRSLRLLRPIAYMVIAAIVGLVLYQLPHSDLNEARQLTFLGNIYRGEMLFQRSEETYREAASISPELPGAYIGLANQYVSSGRHQEALDLLQEAAVRTNQHPRVSIEKAIVLLTLGQHEEAIHELRAVENSYPYEPRLHEALGVSLLSRGEAHKAIEELEKEVRFSGGSLITYSALGRANLAIEQFSDAANYLEVALRFDPANPSVTMQLADAYTMLGLHIKACAALARVRENDPGNLPLKYKFANCLYRAGRLDDALGHFKQLHIYEPRNTDFLVNMGTVYAAMDSLNRAIEVWKRALELDPDNEIAEENLRKAGE